MLRESVSHRSRMSVAIAAHSLRAVPRDWLPRLRDWAAAHRTPFHMHVAEQTAEVESCRAEYGMRPIELLAADGLLDDRFTAIHATHVDEKELFAIGESGATVCACPTTERDLGDGFLRGYDLMEAGAHIALGSDSQTMLDFFEEMRIVEYNERLQRRRRNVIAAPTGPDRAEPAHALLAHATSNGARSLGLDAGRITAGAHADFQTIDLTHPVIAGWTDDTLAAMVTFCAPTDAVADVWVGGVRRVTDSRHALDGVGVITFRDVVRRLFGRRRVTA
jgi:formimidoylglutamate deiminase